MFDLKNCFFFEFIMAGVQTSLADEPDFELSFLGIVELLEQRMLGLVL